MEGSDVFNIVPSSDWINIATAVTHGNRCAAFRSFLSWVISCIDSITTVVRILLKKSFYAIVSNRKRC